MDERIRELFATLLQVPPDQVGDETAPANLERWDSMRHLIVVAGFEEEFGLDVDPEEAVEMYKDFATFKTILLRRMETRGRRHG